VWIERPNGYSLIVAGPGEMREQHDFDGEPALQAFQMAIAERLAGAGWLLWAHDQDRRAGAERRRSARSTPDRRQKLLRQEPIKI
jgi:hypothetical protein